MLSPIDGRSVSSCVEIVVNGFIRCNVERDYFRKRLTRDFASSTGKSISRAHLCTFVGTFRDRRDSNSALQRAQNNLYGYFAIRRQMLSESVINNTLITTIVHLTLLTG